VATSPSFGYLKYFMTPVYWVIHEEQYHQMTSKLRFKLALPLHPLPCLLNTFNITTPLGIGVMGPIKVKNTRENYLRRY